MPVASTRRQADEDWDSECWAGPNAGEGHKPVVPFEYREWSFLGMAPQNGFAPGVWRCLQLYRLSLGDELELVAILLTIPPTTADNQYLIQMPFSQISDLVPSRIFRNTLKQGRTAAIEDHRAPMVLRTASEIGLVNESTIELGIDRAPLRT
jgi:hypothetical protein